MLELSTQDPETTALLEIATPDLYRRNAFRILGLQVTVTPREIARHQKKLIMFNKLDLQSDSREFGNGLLPLDPPPSVDVIEKATHRLHNPIERVVDELFWFWPQDPNSEEDDALQMVRERNLNAALSCWILHQKDGRAETVATHNLAVLNHLLALDLEAASNVRQLNKSELDLRDHYWTQAYLNWCAVSEDESFWSRVSARIREIDDPRLTTGATRRLRRALPTAILTISAKQAMHAARKGNINEVKLHLRYVWESDFDNSILVRILEREIAPTVEQIKGVCAPAIDAAEVNPNRANKIVRRLLAETKTNLAAVESILGKGHQVTELAYDAVARTMRECILVFGNETANWKECYELLKKARIMARDPSVCERIDNDIHQVKENIDSQRQYEDMKKAITCDRIYDVTINGTRAVVLNACTCCLSKADSEQTVSYSWEERRILQRIKRTLSFDFPLCADCHKHQSEYGQKSFGLVALVALASIAIAVVALSLIGQVDLGLVLIEGALLTTSLFLVLGRAFHLKELPEDHACRERPVRMVSASNTHVTFRFYHPLYAKRFAESNRVKPIERKVTKAPRGGGLISKATLVSTLLPSLAVAGIGQAIAYSVIQDGRKQQSIKIESSNSTQPSKQFEPQMPPSSPQASKTRQKSDPTNVRGSGTQESPTHSTSPPINAVSGLTVKIDTGKARIHTLEAQLEQLDSQLDSLKNQIQQYKVDLADYERKSRSGTYVNEYRYEETLQNHNSLVNQFNSIIEKRKTVYAQYKIEVESVNDMIRRYNAGER